MNFRCPKLLKDARSRSCLMRVPGVCCGNSETSVAAHANWSDYGKGKSIKAHDWASARACFTCHTWLDAGAAPREQKRRLWHAAWVRQLAEWLRRGVITSAIELSNPDPQAFAKAIAQGLIVVYPRASRPQPQE